MKKYGLLSEMGCWYWLVIVSGQLLEPVFKRAKTGLHIREKSWWWHAFQSLRTIAVFMVNLLFFRSASLPDALTRLAASVHGPLGMGFLGDIVAAVDFGALGGLGGAAMMALSFLAVLVVLVVDYLKYRGVDVQEKLAGLKTPWRWAVYYAMVLVLFCSLSIASQESIYARF